MASSVFYRFNSQKAESRITFDGTGISVFDLKREIILANNMSKANDFDLYVYDSATKQGRFTVRPCIPGNCLLSVFVIVRHLQNTRMTRLSYLVHLLSS